MFRLVSITDTYKNKLLSFKDAFIEYGENSIPGSELLDKMDSFDDWMDYIRKNSNACTVSNDWVLTSVFIAVDDNDDVVGIISLRHELNDFLKDFGHVGYSVPPKMRRKGIATFMLKEVLKFAKKVGLKEVQLSSMQDNPASIRTIEKNGGCPVRNVNYLGENLCVFIIKLD